MSPEDRIRMLMEENAMLRERLDATPLDIGELDSPSNSHAPLDVPTLDQINTRVYPTNANAYGYGNLPQYSLTPPAPPSQRERVAAAHQKRRELRKGSGAYGG